MDSSFHGFYRLRLIVNLYFQEYLLTVHEVHEEPEHRHIAQRLGDIVVLFRQQAEYAVEDTVVQLGEVDEAGGHVDEYGTGLFRGLRSLVIVSTTGYAEKEYCNGCNEKLIHISKFGAKLQINL